MNTLCVAWSRETNRLSMLSHDDLMNLNLAAFLEDRPGLVAIKTWCSEAWCGEDDARRFIKAYAALMARRSLVRIEAAPEGRANPDRNPTGTPAEPEVQGRSA